MNSRVEPLRQVITAEQIQKRVKELARQISDDYRGRPIQMLAVLENAFMFQADLGRALEMPVVCQFIKPRYTRPQASSGSDVMEIFFSHEPDIRGQHILLVEGLVHSGVTTEFLMNDLRARGVYLGDADVGSRLFGNDARDAFFSTACYRSLLCRGHNNRSRSPDD